MRVIDILLTYLLQGLPLFNGYEYMTTSFPRSLVLISVGSSVTGSLFNGWEFRVKGVKVE